MFTTDKRTFGKTVEDYCANWLEQQGLQILKQNFSCKLGEIDIIAQDGEQISFVEVRYRKQGTFGGAAASVDRGKRKKLTNTANFFLQTHSQFALKPCRFDVLAVAGSPGQYKVNWIKNAFYAQS